MRYVLQEFDKCYAMKKSNKNAGAKEDEPVLTQKDFELREFVGRMSKRDLILRLHSFFKKCLRLSRAYNFNREFVDQIKVYYECLYENNHLEDKLITELGFFFDTAYQKLLKKAENDEKYKDNEEF